MIRISVSSKLKFLAIVCLVVSAVPSSALAQRMPLWDDEYLQCVDDLDQHFLDCIDEADSLMDIKECQKAHGDGINACQCAFYERKRDRVNFRRHCVKKAEEELL